MTASRPFAEEDSRRSHAELLQAGAIAAAFLALASIDFSWPLRAAASLAAGLVFVRVFMFYHDYQHGAIFREGGWAPRLMNLFGLYILNPPAIWNRSHNYHHQHNAQIATASIGSFPVMTVAQYRAAPPLARLQYRVARHPLTIVFGYVTVFIIGMCLKSFLKDPRRHFDSLVALLLHAALIAALAWAGGWPLVVFALILPLWVACMGGAYLFYIQHNFPDMKLKPREEWDYAFAALHSSSFMDGPPLMHWLTGNIGYHHVHHLNARIPFYRLPEAMAAIPELRNPGRTGLSPRDIAACCSLKLWDPGLGRMIGFQESRGERAAREAATGAN